MQERERGGGGAAKGGRGKREIWSEGEIEKGREGERGMGGRYSEGGREGGRERGER
jgi:hypothetical protein